MRYRKSVRKNPLGGLLCCGLICCCVCFSPYLLIIFGLSFLTTSGTRQTLINEFNSKVSETWTNGGDNGYQDFSTSYTNIDFSFAMNGNSTYSDTMDMSLHTSPIFIFENLASVEDSPQINYNFQSHFFEGTLRFRSMNFIEDIQTNVKLHYLDTLSTSAPKSFDIFSKSTYECECNSDGYNCDSCVLRTFVSEICFVLYTTGSINGCYDYGEYVKYDNHLSHETDDMNYMNMEKDIPIYIRSPFDPEVILYDVTDGDNHFGMTQLDRLTYGILMLSSGSMIVALEWGCCLCCGWLFVIIVILLIKKLKQNSKSQIMVQNQVNPMVQNINPIVQNVNPIVQNVNPMVNQMQNVNPMMQQQQHVKTNPMMGNQMNFNMPMNQQQPNINMIGVNCNSNGGNYHTQVHSQNQMQMHMTMRGQQKFSNVNMMNNMGMQNQMGGQYNNGFKRAY